MIKIRPGLNYCRDCRKTTRWRMRMALQNTLVASPDFFGDRPIVGRRIQDMPRGRTVTRNGPAREVSALSCSECGRAVEV